MTDSDFEVYDSNNHRYTFTSPEEELEVLDAVTAAMSGRPSDQYDIDILPTIDGQPVFPPPESAAADGRGDGGATRDAAAEAAAGDAETRRDAVDETAAATGNAADVAAPSESLPDAAAALRRELDAREHAVRTNLRGLTRRVTRAAEDRPERVFYTHNEWPGKEFTQDEVDRINRGESILPPEPPAGGEAAAGGAEPPREGPRAGEGEPGAPPPAPDWYGKYYDGTGKSWETFNIKDYPGITPKTFKEIYGNDLYQQGFGQFIQAVDPSKMDIWTRVHENAEAEMGSLSPEDRRFLQFAQYEFTKNVVEYEKIAKTFNKDTVNMLAAVNPDFREIVDMHGVDLAAQTYKEAIFFVGMRNKGEFDKTAQSFKVWDDAKSMERAKKAEEKVQQICKEAGIERRNFESFFGIGEKGKDANDPAVRERLIAHLDGQAKTFMTTKEWIKHAWKGGHSGKAQRLIEEARRAMPHSRLLGPTSKYMSAMLNARKNIASVMVDTISSPEMRNRIERAALLGEEFKAPREQMGPKTLSQMRSDLNREELKDEKIEEYVEKRLNTIEDFDSKPAWEKDRIVGDLKHEMAQKYVGGTERHVGGGGILAWLFRILFARKFDKAARAAIEKRERRES